MELCCTLAATWPYRSRTPVLTSNNSETSAARLGSARVGMTRGLFPAWQLQDTCGSEARSSWTCVAIPTAV